MSDVAPTTENVAVQLSASFTDAGTQDTHTATIDWGDGTTPQTIAVVQGAGTGTLTASHTYGDNGSFDVKVRVADDDTLVGTGSTTVNVANTVPTVVIDRTSTTSFGGVATVVGTVGVPIAFNGAATDPGSDDLVVTWAFGDGTSSVSTSLVNPPQPDPLPSASVQPSILRSTGTARRDQRVHLPRDVVGPRRRRRRRRPGRRRCDRAGEPHSRAAPRDLAEPVRRQRSLATTDLACYLRVISHASLVFGAGNPLALTTVADAHVVLFKDPKLDRALLDRELLVAWLNVANGGLRLLTPFDFNGDGRPDKTVAAVLSELEVVRLNPASTPKQLQNAATLASALSKFGTT